MRATFLIPCMAAILAMSGCTSYYKVTDPTTGKIHYTTEVSRAGSAVKLKDAATGDEVTIQNSQVSKVKREEFEANCSGTK